MCLHNLCDSFTCIVDYHRYDFPRSHQGGDHAAGEGKDKDGQQQQQSAGPRRHCYTNAAPGEVAGSSSSTTAEVFTFNNNALTAPSSAAAMAMSPSIYSNMASPFPLASPNPALLPMTPFSPPPSVNRTLKPKNAASGGAAEGGAPPPSVNRMLKPLRKYPTSCLFIESWPSPNNWICLF